MNSSSKRYLHSAGHRTGFFNSTKRLSADQQQALDLANQVGRSVQRGTREDIGEAIANNDLFETLRPPQKEIYNKIMKRDNGGEPVWVSFKRPGKKPVLGLQYVNGTFYIYDPGVRQPVAAQPMSMRDLTEYLQQTKAETTEAGKGMISRQAIRSAIKRNMVIDDIMEAIGAMDVAPLRNMKGERLLQKMDMLPPTARWAAQGIAHALGRNLLWGEQDIKIRRLNGLQMAQLIARMVDESVTPNDAARYLNNLYGGKEYKEQIARFSEKRMKTTTAYHGDDYQVANNILRLLGNEYSRHGVVRYDSLLSSYHYLKKIKRPDRRIGLYVRAFGAALDAAVESYKQQRNPAFDQDAIQEVYVKHLRNGLNLLAESLGKPSPV